MPETVLPQELVYRLVRETRGPPPMHQWTVGDVYRVLRAHLDTTGAGHVWLSSIDVVLDRDRVRVTLGTQPGALPASPVRHAPPMRLGTASLKHASY
jgi:hypothetical protein